MSRSVLLDGNDYFAWTPQGNFAGLGAQTHVAIVKPVSGAAFGAVLGYQVTPNFWAMMLTAASPAELFWTDGPNDDMSGLTLVIGEWYLVAWSKPAGSSAGRFHTYRYSTGTWSHANGSFALGDRSTVTSIRVGEDFGGTGLNGNVLIAGVWDSELSDVTIEGLALRKGTWAVAGADEAWRFDTVNSTLGTFIHGGTATPTSAIGSDPALSLDGDAPTGWSDYVGPYGSRVVDDFVGTDASINGRTATPGPGAWQGPWISGGDIALATVSNELQSGASRGSGVIYPVQYGPDMEIALTMLSPISGSELVLIAFSNGYGPFPDTYGDGNFYHLTIQPGGGGDPGFYEFRKNMATISTLLIDGSAGFSGGTLEAGIPETFAFSVVEEGSGTRCRVWRVVGGTWTEMANVLDTGTRPSGLRYAGVEMSPGGSAMRLKDFIAGTISTEVASPAVSFLSAIGL